MSTARFQQLAGILHEVIEDAAILNELAPAPYRVFKISIGEDDLAATKVSIHGTSSSQKYFSSPERYKQHFITQCKERINNVVAKTTSLDIPSASGRRVEDIHRYAILLAINKALPDLITVEEIGGPYENLEDAKAAQAAAAGGTTNATDRLAGMRTSSGTRMKRS